VDEKLIGFLYYYFAGEYPNIEEVDYRLRITYIYLMFRFSITFLLLPAAADHKIYRGPIKTQTKKTLRSVLGINNSNNTPDTDIYTEKQINE
jgi:hypothetical protein